MTSRCPYNPEHIMPTDAFLNHLRKCKATNKNEFAQCKYDPLHVIRKIVLERHYQECSANTQKNQTSYVDETWNDNTFASKDWDEEESEESLEVKPSKRQNKREAQRQKHGQNAAPPIQFEAEKESKYTKKWMKKPPEEKVEDTIPFKCDESVIEEPVKPYEVKKKKKKAPEDHIQSFKKAQQSKIQDWD